MKKSQKKTAHFNIPSRVGILGVVACLIGAASLLGIFLVYQNTNTQIESLAEQNLKSMVKSEQLTYCIDHQVRPCTQDAINVWADQHPDQ